MKYNEIISDGYYIVVPPGQIAKRSEPPYGSGSLMNPNGITPACISSGTVYYSNGTSVLLSSLTNSEFITAP